MVKVGDWVRIAEVPTEYKWAKGSAGKVVEVVPGDFWPYCVELDGREVWAYEVAPATQPAEAAEPASEPVEVGDRVRIVTMPEADSGHTDWMIGVEGLYLGTFATDPPAWATRGDEYPADSPVVNVDGVWVAGSVQRVDEPASEPESPRAYVLDTAKSLVLGDRNNTYGPPTQDFQRTAGVLSSLGYRKGDGQPLEAHDISVILAAVKLSRLMWSPDKADSWIDLAGYAACGHECVVDNGKDSV